MYNQKEFEVHNVKLWVANILIFPRDGVSMGGSKKVQPYAQ